MMLHEMSIESLHQMLRAREISIQELCRSTLARIAEVESRVHSFITVDEPGAMQQAKALDEQIASNAVHWTLLTGIPLAVKDNFCTRNLRTTCGSKILGAYVPPYDATVVRKLREAGAVIVGKTNCDEFAMGSSTENSAFYCTRNPWNLHCVPGGSSGGSATAVACGQAVGSLGSDTGGSVRQPAALCGILGMKPTYGRVSRYGLVAFASSLDQIGPFSRNVRDMAILLQAIAGHDPLDSTSAEAPVENYLAELDRPLNRLRVGVPQECFGEGLDPQVKAKVQEAIDLYAKLGCNVQEVSLPHSKHAIATYYIIAPAEASSNLARYDGVRYGFRAPQYGTLAEMYQKTRNEGFGAEVKRRIMIGTYVLSAGYYDAHYLKAQKVRTLIRRDFEQAFEKVDVIVGPTSPTTAFQLGEKSNDPLAMYLSDIYTVTGNLAGIPGLSIPCGFSNEGLPIGLQISGRHFEEGRILQAAYAYESAASWRRPPLPL
jgi:aspartyl-tRNA(Asn)/glutamyl-tRNA(Gln) amidotransferase subunit A